MQNERLMCVTNWKVSGRRLSWHVVRSSVSSCWSSEIIHEISESG